MESLCVRMTSNGTFKQSQTSSSSSAVPGDKTRSPTPGSIRLESPPVMDGASSHTNRSSESSCCVTSTLISVSFPILKKNDSPRVSHGLGILWVDSVVRKKLGVGEGS